MDPVAAAFVSAYLQVLVDRMASHSAINLFSGQIPTNEHLRKLRRALQSVAAVHEDAEGKQVTNPAVKVWLDELKDVVHDAEDTIDEISTQSLQNTATKVRRFMTTALNTLVQRTDPKIVKLLERLEALAKQKDDIGLRESTGGGKSLYRFPTTSLVKESDIFGRDADKEAIIKLLLSDDASPNHMGVFAVTGLGGVGKTALAQIVYNDIRVKQHFELHAWVRVSYVFDVFEVTKTILEAVTSRACEIRDLNLLQKMLKETLMGKRFLLVMDDVWNENYADWELLSLPFRLGALASRVIVTTRNGSVASTMRAIEIHLKELSDEDCWSIFAKHAFPSYDSDAEAYIEQEAIGRQIVKKCKGLPLAAKAIGSLLWSKQDVDEWNKILKSKFWHLPEGGRIILSTLSLSYQYLPSYLKRCFAYCSIFPKGHSFDKDELVLQWMGEGFLQESENKTLEEVGDEYFHDLVSRSLFKQSSDKDSRFVMHDLVHDLAIVVSGQLCARLEGEYSQKIWKNARYLFYNLQRSNYKSEPEALYQAQRLRTFLLSSTAYLPENASQKLLSTQTRLRVVSLPGYGHMTGLLDWIFKNKHLRYVDISQTAVKVLPDSMCQLYNLQTLKLSRCKDLAELPKDMGELKNLRHLDLSYTSIQSLPSSVDELCNLQRLNLSGCTKLAKLPTDMRKLTNLRHLDLTATNFRGLPDSLCQLCNLQTLELFGCLRLEELPKEMNLSGLRHLDITDTKIKAMPSQLDRLKCLRSLPTFICSSPSTQTGSRIRELGGLADLGKKLSILELQHVQSPVDAEEANLKNKKHLEELELTWDTDPNISEDQRLVLDGLRPHTNLKCLIIKCYSGRSFPDWVGCGSFSNIATLHLIDCKYCSSLPPLWQLPCLNNLSIVGFDGVVEICTPIDRFKVLQVLKLEKMLNWTKWLRSGARNEDGTFPHLRELCIMGCPLLTGELPINLPSLAKLEINECPRLVVAPPFPTIPAECEIQLIRCNNDLPNALPTRMQKLVVKGFESLESFGHKMDFANSSLQYLGINLCSKLKNLPGAGLPYILKTLVIDYCNELELPMVLAYQSLEKLALTSSCDSLTDLKLEFFPKLSDIKIDGCKNLKTLTTPPRHELDLVLTQITIGNCEQFENFPSGGLRAPLLSRFSVKNCLRLRSLPDNMSQLLPSLEKMEIFDCPVVDPVPEGGWPCNLNSIVVKGCGTLIRGGVPSRLSFF